MSGLLFPKYIVVYILCWICIPGILTLTWYTYMEKALNLGKIGCFFFLFFIFFIENGILLGG